MARLACAAHLSNAIVHSMVMRSSFYPFIWCLGVRGRMFCVDFDTHCVTDGVLPVLSVAPAPLQVRQLPVVVRWAIKTRIDAGSHPPCETNRDLERGGGHDVAAFSWDQSTNTLFTVERKNSRKSPATRPPTPCLCTHLAPSPISTKPQRLSTCSETP